jgi:NADH:ubiquinone reductase (non-electrogenic)
LAVVKPEDRPKMVILGAGWAAVNMIQDLDERTLKQYNILVCAPTNHFVNTPLLPSITVGTLGPRTIAEPIRNFIVRHRRNCPESFIKFNEMEAVQVDTERKRVLLATPGYEGTTSTFDFKSTKSAKYETDFWVDYDVLVVAAGATTNTFGTPGALEYCTFLKTIQDAQKIRASLLDCFETAALRCTPDAEIDRLLSFVIIGAGPTGVELAAEIRDFVKEDVMPRYSGFKDREIKVQIIEMSPKMLGTYDKLIQKVCAQRFAKNDIEMLTEHQVKEVNWKSVEALDLKTGQLKTIPFGMCVWASGVRPVSVTLQLAKDLQPDARMLEVAPNMRVRGAEGSIFALGDCAKITVPMMHVHARELFDKADVNSDGTLSQDEFEAMIKASRKEFPHLESYLGEASKESIAAMYEKMSSHDLRDNKVGGVSLAEFENALREVDKELKMLPPTAQVAAQQGEYLAKVFNTMKYEELGHEAGFEPQFQYNHQGSMAYIGGEHAVLDSPVFGINSGLLTYIMWKGIYFGKSVSFTMKLNMCFDWAKSWFLGRDTSRF